MRIALLGGTGFIGSHLAKSLEDHEVYTVSRRPSNSPFHVQADVTRPESISMALGAIEPEIIFHLVGYGNPKNDSQASEDQHIVVEGTRNILAASAGAKKIIYLSSIWVYGQPKQLPIPEMHPTNPISNYGKSRLAAEKLIIEHKKQLRYTILRLGNLYGQESPNFITATIKRMLAGEPPIIIGDGTQTRDYIYIDDATAAFHKCIEHADDTILNIGTGIGTSVNEAIAQITKQLHSELQPIHKPSKASEVTKMALDCSLAKKTLGWQATTTLHEGIAKTIQQLRTKPSS